MGTTTSTPSTKVLYGLGIVVFSFFMPTWSVKRSLSGCARWLSMLSSLPTRTSEIGTRTVKHALSLNCIVCIEAVFDLATTQFFWFWPFTNFLRWPILDTISIFTPRDVQGLLVNKLYSWLRGGCCFESYSTHWWFLNSFHSFLDYWLNWQISSTGSPMFTDSQPQVSALQSLSARTWTWFYKENYTMPVLTTLIDGNFLTSQSECLKTSNV